MQLHRVDSDTLETASILLNAPSIWNNRKKYQLEDKENYDMCTALREWQEEITERIERETTDKNSIENLQSLILTEGFDIERALRALRIPAEKWDEYKKALARKKR